MYRRHAEPSRSPTAPAASLASHHSRLLGQHQTPRTTAPVNPLPHNNSPTPRCTAHHRVAPRAPRAGPPSARAATPTIPAGHTDLPPAACRCDQHRYPRDGAPADRTKPPPSRTLQHQHPAAHNVGTPPRTTRRAELADPAPAARGSRAPARPAAAAHRRAVQQLSPQVAPSSRQWHAGAPTAGTPAPGYPSRSPRPPPTAAARHRTRDPRAPPVTVPDRPAPATSREPRRSPAPAPTARAVRSSPASCPRKAPRRADELADGAERVNRHQHPSNTSPTSRAQHCRDTDPAPRTPVDAAAAHKTRHLPPTRRRAPRPGSRIPAPAECAIPAGSTSPPRRATPTPPRSPICNH